MMGVGRAWVIVFGVMCVQSCVRLVWSVVLAWELVASELSTNSW